MRTLAQLRPSIGLKLSDHFYSGTANGSGQSTTTLVDSDLVGYPTGWWNGHWLLCTTVATAQPRYVNTFTGSSGTLAWTAALSAAPTAATYELYPFDPTLIPTAINAVTAALYPRIGRQVVDDSFYTDSALWNGGFEQWTSSSAAVGWTAVGPTLARIDSSTLAQVDGGSYSARLTGTAGYLDLSTAQRVALSDYHGQSVTVYVLLKSNVASDARVRIIDMDGATTLATSDYHTGNGIYQLLSVAATFTDAESQSADIRILNDSGASTIDIMQVWIEGGPWRRRFRSPVTLPRGPSQVFVAKARRREDFKRQDWQPINFAIQHHD